MIELGKRLRAGGLVPRALAAWAGSDRLSALPALVPRTSEPTPAATLLALFVAGDHVAAARMPMLDDLDRAELVDLEGDRVRARVSILPAGRSLVVCDRLDTSDSLDVVCWPDDSSYHTALAIPPGRRERWLDLGTGSAFAPLYRPELAQMIVAADLNPRAVRYARLGAALSNVQLTVCEADLGTGVPAGPYDLITCNAPIPSETSFSHGPPMSSRFMNASRSRWRTTDESFLARLFRDANALVSPEGLIIVHAALDAMLPIVTDLPGERVVIQYTPDDTRAFGVAWWRPAAESRLVVTRRPLTDERPHLTHEDRLTSLEPEA